LDKDVKSLYKSVQFQYPEGPAGLLDLPKHQKQ